MKLAILMRRYALSTFWRLLQSIHAMETTLRAGRCYGSKIYETILMQRSALSIFWHRLQSIRAMMAIRKRWPVLGVISFTSIKDI